MSDPLCGERQRQKLSLVQKSTFLSLMGISFLDELSWDAFHEGNHMMGYVLKYKQRFGFYPRELLADKIYCTRANRTDLKRLGIKLLAKPLGRPSAVQVHVRPGERNPIEGKFGQAKRAYGLDRIKARLKGTSESWIASIFLVLNLVKLGGEALPCHIIRLAESFSASACQVFLTQLAYHEVRHSFFNIKICEANRVNIKIVA